MNNPLRLATILGLLFTAWGVIFWVKTGQENMTPLIPSIFGVIFLLFAWIGKKPGKLAMAMHILALIAVVGAGAAIWRMTKAEVGSDGFMANAGFALGCLIFLTVGMMGFVKMRRSQKS